MEKENETSELDAPGLATLNNAVDSAMFLVKKLGHQIDWIVGSKETGAYGSCCKCLQPWGLEVFTGPDAVQWATSTLMETMIPKERRGIVKAFIVEAIQCEFGRVDLPKGFGYRFNRTFSEDELIDMFYTCYDSFLAPSAMSGRSQLVCPRLLSMR